MTSKPCIVCGAPTLVGDGPTLCPTCGLRAALAGGAALGGAGVSSTSDAAMAEPPVRVADLEVLEEIARGGMGVVYRARQLSLDRIVAVKIPLPGLASPEYLRRFRSEASTAAGLQHPNIVAIHEVGVSDGRQYLVMDYVAGRSLAQRIADAGGSPRDFRQIARWMAAIADAVQHAHDRGVLHRDLKPSNVLIDEQDRPRITDFGLAKQVGDESELTLSGQALGSPSFMPPEQAGGPERVSRRSDVYGLGATLYYALTARAPFQGDTPSAVMHQVLTAQPPPPRRLDPAIPRDLETISLKCLEKDPRRRYDSAKAVAEDLGRFLDGRPIVARPVGPAGRLSRWVRRKPAIAVLTAAVVLTLAAAGWLAFQLKLQRVERAVMAAADATMRADRGAAMQAIEDARREGLPDEWVHILKGQLALYTARPETAIGELEQAIAQAPQSVNARAYLAAAYLYCGRIDDYVKTLTQLLRENPDPRTWQEYQSLGAAMVVGYPDTGKPVRYLQRAAELHPSAFTYSQFALAESFQAQNTGDYALARKALEDCRTSEGMFKAGESAPALPRLNALNIALRLAPDGDRAALQDEAARVAHDAAKFGSSLGMVQRATFFGLTGDRQAEVNEWQKMIAVAGGASGFASYYSAAMFANQRSAEALAVLETPAPSPELWPTTSRAYLLLDLGRPVEARRLYDQAEATQRSERTNLETILLLAGDPESAAADARRSLAAFPSGDPLADSLRPALEYVAGLRSAENLIQAAGGSRNAAGTAHYFVGLSLLAGGQREAARHHFEQSAALSCHLHHPYHWSRAFVARLDQDPRWPRWIRK